MLKSILYIAVPFGIVCLVAYLIWEDKKAQEPDEDDLKNLVMEESRAMKALIEANAWYDLNFDHKFDPYKAACHVKTKEEFESFSRKDGLLKIKNHLDRIPVPNETDAKNRQIYKEYLAKADAAMKLVTEYPEKYDEECNLIDLECCEMLKIPEKQSSYNIRLVMIFNKKFKTFDYSPDEYLE